MIGQGFPADGRPPLEGKSFAGVCAGKDDAGWSEVSVAIGSAESVITNDGWRLTRFLDDDKGQMINLVEDPDELHNLYMDPAYADKRNELFERLVDVMARPRRLPQYRNLPLIDGLKSAHSFRSNV